MVAIVVEAPPDPSPNIGVIPVGIIAKVVGALNVVVAALNVSGPVNVYPCVWSKHSGSSLPVVEDAARMLLCSTLQLDVARDDGSTKRAPLEPNDVDAPACAPVASCEIPLTLSVALEAPAIDVERKMPSDGIAVFGCVDHAALERSVV